MMYRATETALVVCVDGKPYSRAALPDMVMRCSGGDTGLGRHTRSLMIPETMTPEAKRLTSGLANCSYSHQYRSGRNIMKKVWVPRFAEKAKYESKVGERTSA